MVRIEKPDKKAIASLQSWQDVTQGNVYLHSLDRLIWKDPDTPDLLVFKSRKYESPLSALLAKFPLGVVHWGAELLVTNFISRSCVLSSNQI